MLVLMMGTIVVRKRISSYQRAIADRTYLCGNIIMDQNSMYNILSALIKNVVLDNTVTVGGLDLFIPITIFLK